MGVIKTALIFRNNEPLEVAKRCEEFYFKGYRFNVALEKSKEEYIKKNYKGHCKVIQCSHNK